MTLIFLFSCKKLGWDGGRLQELILLSPVLLYVCFNVLVGWSCWYVQLNVTLARSTSFCFLPSHIHTICSLTIISNSTKLSHILLQYSVDVFKVQTKCPCESYISDCTNNFLMLSRNLLTLLRFVPYSILQITCLVVHVKVVPKILIHFPEQF